MIDRAGLLRRTGIGAAALSLPALEHVHTALADSPGGNYPAHPSWQFVFVNNATTSPAFVATQYGAQDAAALVGGSSVWTGSPSGDVPTMVKAFDVAVAAKTTGGVALTLVDPLAFDASIGRAAKAGIPVMAYSVDVTTTRPVPYVGQDPYTSGTMLGDRIAGLLPGGGEVGLFFSTSGPQTETRVQGVLEAVKRAGAPVRVRTVAIGADFNVALQRVDAWYLAHKTAKGMFAVDSGATQAVGLVMKKYGLRAKGVRGGGYDLLATTLQLIDQGHLDFAFDQQPYLQGYLAVLQLFIARLSGGLVAPATASTGATLVTKANVARFLSVRTRYEGSSSRHRYPVF
jgi:simple sugar transport system substrate-binding protein